MKTLLLIIVSLSFFSCSTTPPKVMGASDREPASFQSCLEAMGQIMNYKPFYGPGANVFSKAKNYAELEALYGGENLIEIQRRMSNAEILANNANVKKIALESYEVQAIPGKNTKVTTADTNVIYSATSNSQVNKNHYCYDTKGTIGFCFGRATITHMEAIVRDIHPDLVKKIWIAGDMGVWGHHVATMLYTEKGWMVLDTNIGHAVPVDYWIEYYMPQKQKGAKEIMVFITQAGRFGPYDNRPYNAVDLFNTQSEDFNKAADYFNGYFHDYFNSLDNVRSKPLYQQ
jgi:hypothetical protein